MDLSNILQQGITISDVIARMNQGYKNEHEKLVETGSFIKDELPEQFVQIIQLADEALEGLLLLPGTGGELYPVGNPPRWHDNPVNDNEYRWVLNRMDHWPTLLKAYLMTGEEKYAHKVIEELKDWVKQCPRPKLSHNAEEMIAIYDSPIVWRSLDAGIRMFRAWATLPRFLAGTGLLSEELVTNLLLSVNDHVSVLRTASPLIFPKADHNHYLMEMLGLYKATCDFPELLNAGEDNLFAKREIERCLNVQMTEEGGHFEGSPGYHCDVMYLFHLAQYIAVQNKTTFSDKFHQLMEKSVEYMFHVTRPDGNTVPWGDTDVQPGGVRSCAYRFFAYEDETCLHNLKRLLGTEKLERLGLNYLWDAPDSRRFAAVLKSPPSEQLHYPLGKFYRELDQVSMRSAWSPEALSAFFACRTPVIIEHQHIDPAGFDFMAFGKPLVVDPGRYTYSEQPLRRVFKSATYHNTITINHTEPFEYISSWKYGPQKEGIISKYYPGSDYMAAESMQKNFDPATHHRLFALMENKFLLIIDHVKQLEPADSVQLYYHLDTTKVKLVDSVIVDESEVRVEIATTANVTATLQPGFVSPVRDIKHDSTIIKYESTDHDTARNYVTIIYPYQMSDKKPELGVITVQEENDIVNVVFSINRKKHNCKWAINSSFFSF